MSNQPTRFVIGFAAGAVAHLAFQGTLGAGLFLAQLVPASPWSLTPVPPFGVPRSLSLTFWAGLWGIAYAILEPRLTHFFGRWLGGLVFGIAPLLGHWFIALPLKGRPVGGGFDPAVVPIEIAFHAVYGLGLAICFGAAYAFTRPLFGAPPKILRG
jgi:hypothetical protein